MTQVRDIVNTIEAWAPAATAQSYDNVGLLVGDHNQDVSKVIVALDLTPAVIAEAVSKKCELILTHHPTIFTPIHSIDRNNFTGSMLHDLIRSNISLVAAHTNLDAARHGVSFELASTLGLTEIEFLKPLSDTIRKLVTFVPLDAIDDVREALAAAGAGRIGNYDSCGFAVQGSGYFRPLEGSSPSVGSVNETSRQDEIRFEVEVSVWNIESTVAALKEAHPYEEVAYDIYTVSQPSTNSGMGAIGLLPSAEPLTAFLDRVGKVLQAAALRFVGEPDRSISRVAVCGGSGSSLTRDAIRRGADAFVTADITYHKFFDVLKTDGRPAMALIDAGHYETEAMTESLLCRHLSEKLPEVTFISTQTRSSPVLTHLTRQPI